MKNSNWTEEDLAVLRENIHLSSRELGTLLNRTPTAIRHKKSHLKKPPVYGPHRRPGAKPGELHHKAKLTEELVREMRQKYAEGGKSMFRVWEEYLDVVDVSLNTVSNVLMRKTWRHVV